MLKCDFSIDYWDLGDPIYECVSCHAWFWYEERLLSAGTKESPEYSGCCIRGKIKLPTLKSPPEDLSDLFFGMNEISKHFLDNIRYYNNMYCFTSMSGSIDPSLNNGRGPPVFRMCGENVHRIGSLLPLEGNPPKFAQLYIYDTENEIQNRRAVIW